MPSQPGQLEWETCRNFAVRRLVDTGWSSQQYPSHTEITDAKGKRIKRIDHPK